MHGMLKSMLAGDIKKRLDIERIRAIKARIRLFMTLHGASGTDDGDLREAIVAGITVVHINTEVRLAWRHGLDDALAKQPDEIVPYKLLPPVVDSVKQIVAARLALFTTDSVRDQRCSSSLPVIASGEQPPTMDWLEIPPDGREQV